MSEWTVMSLRKKAQQDAVGRVLCSGQTVLPLVAIKAIGSPKHVEFLRNGDASAFGLRASTGSGDQYKVCQYAGRTDLRAVSGAMALLALGKRLPDAPVDVPWRVEGDVLVIDVSALSDAAEDQP